MHAGQVLNLGVTGQSLPLVLRLYKLRDRAAFDQLPYMAFAQSSGADFMNFSADVVETRELVFIPGQRYEAVENMEPNVQYFAVVALFRAPVEQRWRVIFDAKSAATTGITLGLHGCAISVAAGQAPEMPVELMRVAGVRCDGGPG
jgi:type VI secretion system protein VasD